MRPALGMFKVIFGIPVVEVKCAIVSVYVFCLFVSLLFHNLLLFSVPVTLSWTLLKKSSHPQSSSPHFATSFRTSSLFAILSSPILSTWSTHFKLHLNNLFVKLSFSAISSSICTLMSYFNIHDFIYPAVFTVLPLLRFFSISENVSWAYV